MSQRSEKLRRQVEQLKTDVSELKEQQLTTERFNAAAQAVAEESSARQIRAERRKVREAQQEAARWKTNVILALLLAALSAWVALVVTVRAAVSPPDPAVSAEETTPAADVLYIPESLTASEAPEEPENERIEAALLERATVLENVTVTHYDCCVRCCGKTDGITASGMQATPYVTVAVDPDVIPLGADVLVDYGDGELQYYRADDTGSGVKGSHIDLCVSSHEEALQLGRQTATVYWVVPEE